MATPAFAQDMASCAALDADLDRLACYDRVSGRTPVAEAAPTAGAWRVRVEKSDFKDTTDVYVSLESDELLTCGMFDKSHGTLMIRCKENTTAVFLSTSCHLA